LFIILYIIVVYNIIINNIKKYNIIIIIELYNCNYNSDNRFPLSMCNVIVNAVLYF